MQRNEQHHERDRAATAAADSFGLPRAAAPDLAPASIVGTPILGPPGHRRGRHDRPAGSQVLPAR